MEENKKMTIEEAINIIDTMYQQRWEITETKENEQIIIHPDMFDKVKYNEFEWASILALRELINKRCENTQLKSRIEEAIKYIDDLEKDMEMYYISNENKLSKLAEKVAIKPIIAVYSKIISSYEIIKKILKDKEVE